MQIADVLQRHKTFSFEVFPPKLDQPIEPLYETLEQLYTFRPDFISCTYGAGGTNKGRNTEIVHAIQSSGQTVALAHFTCIGNTRSDIRAAMEEYQSLGVRNVLALRGDLPADWTGTRGDFAHADELIAFVRSLRPDLCVAAAAYPEKHLTAPSLVADIDCLKRKQDNGAAFFMTQLCHDPDAFARFVEQARAQGITLPIVAGIMPVLNKDAVIRMAVSNGCSIPAALSCIIGRYGNDPDAFRQAGKEFTAASFVRFLNAGADGLHIYTLNRFKAVSDIIALSGMRNAPCFGSTSEEQA